MKMMEAFWRESKKSMGKKQYWLGIRKERNQKGIIVEMRKAKENQRRMKELWARKGNIQLQYE